MTLGGWTFLSRPADVDESQYPGEAPGIYVLRLAESKARACSELPRTDSIILAADTTVADGKAILGKPKDTLHAMEMLRNLRGHTHQVYTAIALLRPSDGRLVTDLCVTDVPMREYRDDEIEAYVATGDPLDKAGAYAIQNAGFHPVEGMCGCYASVMGLPLCHLTRSLHKLDVVPRNETASKCQSTLGYACPISSAVLSGETPG